MRKPLLPVTAGVLFVSLLAGCGQRGPATGDDSGADGSRATQAAKPQETDAAPGNWAAYNRTPAGDRFSPLTEIDRSNVGGLELRCAYSLPEVSSLQTGPIVVDGTMYFTTETRSYAIDAATCAEKWRVERPLEHPSTLSVHRGFAYLDGRLFRGTTDGHVLALDAADGHTIWDHEIDVKAPGMTMPMAPIAADGRVFIGNAGGDQVGVTGHVYALDAADGHVLWRFDVVPDSPDVRATWPNSDRYPISGGAFWTSFTYDAANGVLYVPAGNAAPDFDVEARGGDNLYSDSVIAIDASTGRMLAYNQLVKRDKHDWDVNSPPMLAKTRSGRLIIASANKNGVLSVLDRSQVASRPADADPATLLPVLYEAPTTTRENVDADLSRDKPVHFCPGIQGGNEWNGAAFDPKEDALYVGAVDWCATVQLQKDLAVPPAGQIWFGSVQAATGIQDPADQAKGWLTAYDADTGKIRWRFAAPKPILAGVTPTAGGLVFSADLGGMLRAFDAGTGKVLWTYDAGQSTGGGIVSYTAGGHQLIGVAAGMKSPIWPGAADKSRILVFGLP